ncbi:uncharacterized protein CLUP02_01382 [Colletotrichum lupini]|uniref:Uncharacterized protein n=1 Tax=Colletotrichum lupini TaxID=145971 RepID=A0A9Q8SCL8_9PEZI|nr:uncharacterized protein CLUP02_01382 [Colletotrichum lupini]UQC74730.1 hypothetical protein CLUP02_01382 [Colletotrichum lupini]
MSIMSKAKKRRTGEDFSPLALTWDSSAESLAVLLRGWTQVCLVTGGPVHWREWNKMKLKTEKCEVTTAGPACELEDKWLTGVRDTADCQTEVQAAVGGMWGTGELPLVPESSGPMSKPRRITSSETGPVIHHITRLFVFILLPGYSMRMTQLPKAVLATEPPSSSSCMERATSGFFPEATNVMETTGSPTTHDTA